MAEIDVPPIVVTLKMSQEEADALYFLLVNLPHDFAYRGKLQGVVNALGEYRKRISGAT